MKYFRILFALVVSVLFLTSCSSSDEADIKAVCQKQIDAINSENIQDVLSTPDQTSPYFKSSEQIFTRIFEIFDLELTLDNVKINKVENGIAEVELTLTTKKKSGPEFSDNVSVSLSILKKTENGWKFAESRSKSMEPLKK